MENKVNYIHATNFINLFDTPRDQGNRKNKAESKKMGLRFFPVKFHGYVLFKLTQNVYYALILHHL